MSNYRGVIILTAFAKIFEVAILDRLISFLEQNKILVDTQYAYRKDCSTKKALFNIITAIYDALDNGEKVCVISYDLSKAFDVLNHDVLLTKLDKYGIRGQAYALMASYLQNRTHTVKVNSNNMNVLSEPIVLKQGVDQGSHLGPICFSIGVNDLAIKLNASAKKERNKCVLAQFADDSSVVCFAKTLQELNIHANNNVTAYIDYCKNNGLLINEDKTQVMMFFKSYDNKTTIDLDVSGKILECCEEQTILGLTLQNNLKPDKHIDKLGKKLSSACFLLRTLQSEVPKQSLMSVYHAHFVSHILYCAIFIGMSNEISKLMVLQKRAARIINKSHPGAHCKPIFKSLNMLTIPWLIIVEACLFVLKNPDIFVRNEQRYRYETRQRQLIINPRTEYAFSNKSPKVFCTNIYNHFKEIVDFFSNRKNFICRKKLVKLLIKYPVYTIKEAFEIKNQILNDLKKGP